MQGALSGQHEATLFKVLNFLKQLASSVNSLNSGFEVLLTQSPKPEPLPISVPSPPGAASIISLEVTLPHPHGAVPSPLFRQFRLLLFTYFSQQPSTYPTNTTKIAFTSSLLSGKAVVWALAVFSVKQDFYNLILRPPPRRWGRFLDPPVKGREAADRLLSFRQDGQSVSEFAPPLPPDPTQPPIPDLPASVVSPVSPGSKEPMQLGRSTGKEEVGDPISLICCREGGHFHAHCLDLPKGRAS